MRRSATKPEGPAEDRSTASPVGFAGGLIGSLIAIDLTLILINVVGAPSFLNLDEEGNFPTWYSSVKLLAVALAAVGCMRLEPRAERRGLGGLVWPIVAGLFVMLSLDEAATVHERVAAWLMSGDGAGSLRDRLLGGDSAKDAFAWPVLFAPLVLAVIYFLTSSILGKMRRDRRGLLLGLAGCSAFLGAVLLEGAAVYTSPPIDAWGDAEMARYYRFMIAEESLELLGTTLMLTALLLHARFLERGPEPARGA